MGPVADTEGQVTRTDTVGVWVGVHAVVCVCVES